MEGDTLYRKVKSQSLASQSDPRYERSQRPLLKYFYRTPAHLFEMSNPNYYLKIDPLLRTEVGQSMEEDQLVYQFQRGAELRGAIDGRVYFYTRLWATDARYLDYVDRYIRQFRAIPGAGFYKRADQLWGIDNSYQYINAVGYVGFNVSEHLGFQFGHGDNFIGNGYRSLCYALLWHRRYFTQSGCRPV